LRDHTFYVTICYRVAGKTGACVKRWRFSNNNFKSMQNVSDTQRYSFRTYTYLWGH